MPGHATSDAVRALRALACTLDRMHRECRATRRSEVWGAFKARTLPSVLAQATPAPYQNLVRRYRLSGPRHASGVLIAGRRLFVRLLRAEVGCNCAPSQLDREMAGLASALACSRALDEPLVQMLAEAPLLSGIKPRRLAALFSLDTSPKKLWHTAELGPMIRHQLEVPLDLDACWNDRGLPETNVGSTSLASRSSILPYCRTLSGLLRDPKPPLELLRRVKEFAKTASKHPDSPLPEELATVLYGTAIALGLLRHGKRITGLDDEGIRLCFEWITDQPWLPDELRNPLLQARGVLGRSAESSARIFHHGGTENTEPIEG